MGGWWCGWSARGPASHRLHGTAWRELHHARQLRCFQRPPTLDCRAHLGELPCDPLGYCSRQPHLVAAPCCCSLPRMQPYQMAGAIICNPSAAAVGTCFFWQRMHRAAACSAAFCWPLLNRGLRRATRDEVEDFRADSGWNFSTTTRQASAAAPPANSKWAVPLAPG